jgi:tryptophan-rich sensory protein
MQPQPTGVPLAQSSAIALMIFFVVSFSAAATGAVFRPGAWYARLRKPSWTPPNWVFPLVWSVLFCAIAVSGWLVWETGRPAAWPALALYGLHLVVNAAWSFLFFGIKRLDWAMVEVICLWAMIVAVIAAFAPFSALAALLLTPYLAWVTVAAALNFRLLQLNGPRGASSALNPG